MLSTYFFLAREGWQLQEEWKKTCLSIENTGILYINLFLSEF